MAIAAIANIRAFWAGELPTCLPISARLRTNKIGGGPIVGRSYPQNKPIAVSSAVRVLLLSVPMDFTWMKAAVYSGLLSAGGGVSALMNGAGEPIENVDTVP